MLHCSTLPEDVGMLLAAQEISSQQRGCPGIPRLGSQMKEESFSESTIILVLQNKSKMNLCLTLKYSSSTRIRKLHYWWNKRTMWTDKDKECPLSTSKWLNQLTDDFAANLCAITYRDSRNSSLLWSAIGLHRKCTIYFPVFKQEQI